MHINISRKLNVLVQVASIDEKAMLDYCQSEVSATIAEMPQVEARTVPYFFFLSWQLQTDLQWQAARRPYKLYTPVCDRFR